jgi:hypothetical protein
LYPLFIPPSLAKSVELSSVAFAGSLPSGIIKQHPAKTYLTVWDREASSFATKCLVTPICDDVRLLVLRRWFGFVDP